LFEEIPACDRRADEVYLEEVERCDVYLGVFGNDYGFEDAKGISPTEREYDHAGAHHKTRLLYVWGADDKRRHPKMQRLVSRIGGELTRRRVEDISALMSEVYASLVEHLDRSGALQVPPFDTSACDHASQRDISRKRVEWFLDVARRERNFPLKPNTSTVALLTHLHLLDDGKPTNAALLLFGANPQKFHQTAVTKCVHCHGTAFRRPFASMQVYDGDLFDQADQARDFVLSKINRSIGIRDESNVAPATYELPPDAVGEAIVNAIAHRDYHSNASVEVRLFSDRLEIWNPGGLPGNLTLDGLRYDHPSVPYNPLIAEPLYLARYIERIGSGTQTMIELCQEAGIPEPQFEERSGSFVTTIWRDWLTLEVLARHSLSERQMRAVEYLKIKQTITNTIYQSEFVASKRTASRDLDEMITKGVIEKIGTTGKGVYYRLAKGAGKGPKGS
jgi:predicted HTH transcriptional regulator